MNNSGERGNLDEMEWIDGCAQDRGFWEAVARRPPAVPRSRLPKAAAIGGSGMLLKGPQNTQEERGGNRKGRTTIVIPKLRTGRAGENLIKHSAESPLSGQQRAAGKKKGRRRGRLMCVCM